MWEWGGVGDRMCYNIGSIQWFLLLVLLQRNLSYQTAQHALVVSKHCILTHLFDISSVFSKRILIDISRISTLFRYSMSLCCLYYCLITQFLPTEPMGMILLRVSQSLFLLDSWKLLLGSSIITTSHLVFFSLFFNWLIFPSIIVFSNDSCFYIICAKYLSFSIISSSHKKSWFYIIQHEMILFLLWTKILATIFSSTTIRKESILLHSLFLIVQTSQPDVTTREESYVFDNMYFCCQCEASVL